MANKKSKINLGTEPVFTKKDLAPENLKVRVTTRIDLDILDAIKKKADATNMPYQTLINSALREFISKPELKEQVKSNEERLSRVEQVMKLWAKKRKLQLPEDMRNNFSKKTTKKKATKTTAKRA